MPVQTPSALSQAARLLETAARLAAGELRLAKAEISENLGHAGTGAALLGAGILTGLVGLFVLSGAGVAGLVAAGLEVWLAALIVGGGLALIAAICAAIGLSRLKAKRLIPDRTLANIQRDMAALKEAAHG